MDKKVRAFLDEHHSAVMSTVDEDGMPHSVRVAVGLVDGKLWSSGTATRKRTKHVRRDPRVGLLVLNEENRYNWLGLGCRVHILEDDAPQKNLALYRVLAGEPDDLDEYLEAMVAEQRLIYEFEIVKTYGQY